ncbi:Protein of unknown function DUF247, plant [Dillenia turbinata]|uniref:Uncharacterized protein n=1 Tax=Dillenia turbinata TaxID=194707 RepID=A0AAN8UK42_9MAGN
MLHPKRSIFRVADTDTLGKPNAEANMPSVVLIGRAVGEQKLRYLKMFLKQVSNDIWNPNKSSWVSGSSSKKSLIPVQLSIKVMESFDVGKQWEEEDDDGNPLVTSIGNMLQATPSLHPKRPLHHHKVKSFRAMEEQKQRYLSKFLERTKANTSLKTYLRNIEGWIERFRDCYAEPIELSNDQLVKMILVDSAFIIELFRSSDDPKIRDDEGRDCIFGKPYLHGDVLCDLALLENQLPFFVLDGLYDLSVHSSSDDSSKSFLKLTINYFNLQDKIDDYSKINKLPLNHLLDVIRICNVLDLSSNPTPSASQDGDTFEIAPSATKLHECGVRFRAGTRFLILQFENGVLVLPKLVLDFFGPRESVFRNIIAFENCYHERDRHFIDFFMFFDNLIKTTKDVDLLVQNGIIRIYQGDSSMVAKFFNTIVIDIKQDSTKYNFTGVCRELNNYCRIPRHRWMATLRRDYFGNPWTVLSLIAALIIVCKWTSGDCYCISGLKGSISRGCSKKEKGQSDSLATTQLVHEEYRLMVTIRTISFYFTISYSTVVLIFLECIKNAQGYVDPTGENPKKFMLKFGGEVLKIIKSRANNHQLLMGRDKLKLKEKHLPEDYQNHLYDQLMTL